MKARMIFAAAAGLALVVGALLGGWYVLRQQAPAFCEISGRPIHGNMHTVAWVNGERLHACCPRCPLTLASQAEKKVQLLEVTDFATGKRLRPGGAYFVEGSQVHACSGPRVKRDEASTPFVQLFDRCEPSLLAFADEQVARDFVVQNGGAVKRLDQLMQEVAPQKPAAGER